MAASGGSTENTLFENTPDPSSSMASQEKDTPTEITLDPSSSSMAADKEKETPTEITIDPSPSMADKGKTRINPSQKLRNTNRGLKLWDQNDEYVIKKAIGTAEPRRTIVYSAAFIPGDAVTEQKPTTVALKLMNIKDRKEDYREAVAGVRRNQRSHNTMKINASFLSQGYFCIVFPFREVSSLRSLLPENGGGLPENCIKIALRSTLYGLFSIHALSGEMHREISAGNIFFHHPEGLIKLAFAASVYDPYFGTYVAEMKEEEEVGTSSGFLAMKHITKWGRAPEILDSKREGRRYEGFTPKSDIWNVGIVALELAYGEFRVKNRQELLNLAEKISEAKKLPNRLWEEKDEGEEEKKEGKNLVVEFFKGIWKRDERFSSSFGKMVAKCLASDPDKRPKVWDLLGHNFFRNCENVRVLAESVVKNRGRDSDGGEEEDEAEEDQNPSSK